MRRSGEEIESFMGVISLMVLDARVMFLRQRMNGCAVTWTDFGKSV
jgi:hypothetical protein